MRDTEARTQIDELTAQMDGFQERAYKYMQEEAATLNRQMVRVQETLRHLSTVQQKNMEQLGRAARSTRASVDSVATEALRTSETALREGTSARAEVVVLLEAVTELSTRVSRLEETNQQLGALLVGTASK